MAAAGLPVKAGLPYEMPVRDLCTATGAPIAIDNVKLWDEKGSMRLVDWGVRAQRPNRPVGPNIGGEQMTVADVGGFTHGPVTARCDDTASTDQFYVSLSTTGRRSTAAGLIVEYEGHRRIYVQFGLALCLRDPNCSYDLSS